MTKNSEILHECYKIKVYQNTYNSIDSIKGNGRYMQNKKNSMEKKINLVNI